jgi:hypothetical protein
MARTTIVGNQITDAVILDRHVAANAAILTSKLADDLKFIFNDGTRTFSNTLGMGTNKIVDLSTGIANTDAVNVGQLRSEIANALVGGLEYKGTWDISGSTLPADVAKGDLYIITNANSGVTISGVEYTTGDHIVANVAVVGATTVSSWDKIDNTDLVTSVCGYRGVVTLTISDINGLTTALSDKMDDTQISTDSTFASVSNTTVPSTQAIKNYVDNLDPTRIYSETPAGTINGTNSTFTLASAPSSTSLQLYHQGLRLKAGATDDYTISGNQIVLNYGPETGTVLIADYIVL